MLENIGVLLQETQLYQKFTVCETIVLFASFYASSLDVSTVLELRALSDKHNKRLEHTNKAIIYIRKKDWLSLKSIYRRVILENHRLPSEQ